MLKIENLSYQQRGNWLGKPKTTLRNLSLEIRAGESFGFLGHNGAGKTTTIKCILGLLAPKEGKITINGMESALPQARASVGYVAEQPYFYDHLSVNEALQLFGSLAGVPQEGLIERTDRVLERLGIEDRKGSRLRTLSKGLLQRVALAQALINNPSLLILDEPFSGLDPIGREEFRTIFQEERDKGTTLFICTHVLSDVERLCDRASILVRGELQGVFDLHNLPQKAVSYTLEVTGTLSETDKFTNHATSKREQSGYSIYEFCERDAAESALRAALNLGIEVSRYGQMTTSLEQLFKDVVMQSSNPPLREGRS